MATQKKERIKITTPKGTLRYPKLNQINYGTDKFPVKDGNFETEIIFDVNDPQVAELKAKLEPLYEKAKELAELKWSELPVATRKEFEKAGRKGPLLVPCLKEMYDEKTEELLPTLRMKAKMPAGGVRKNGPKAGTPWMMRPVAFDSKGNQLPLFDERGNPHPKARRIYSGTIARLALEIDKNKDDTIGFFIAKDATYGIRASLQAVRVLQYGTANAANAASYGFGDDEDGYDSSDDVDTSAEDNADVAPASNDAGSVSGNF